MVFGLAAAAVIPCASFWVLLAITRADTERNLLLWAGLEATTLGMCWFIGLGSLFLLWLGRRYGAVGRFHCLALCATLAFSMPLAVVLVTVAVSPPPEVDETLYRFLGGAMIGLFLAPIDLLGGWLLWRIAIRPASVPLEEMAEVF
jgi:hypothetical protein